MIIEKVQIGETLGRLIDRSRYRKVLRAEEARLSAEITEQFNREGRVLRTIFDRSGDLPSVDDLSPKERREVMDGIYEEDLKRELYIRSVSTSIKQEDLPLTVSLDVDIHHPPKPLRIKFQNVNQDKRWEGSYDLSERDCLGRIFGVYWDIIFALNKIDSGTFGAKGEELERLREQSHDRAGESLEYVNS